MSCNKGISRRLGAWGLESIKSRDSFRGGWQPREEHHQQHSDRRPRQVSNVPDLHAAHSNAPASCVLKLAQHLQQG